MIDWNGVILALITLIGTVIVTLIPVAVTAFVTAHTAKLIEVKTLANNNQDIANGIVAVVQNVYKALTNSEKLQKAFEALDARLHLPAGQTRQLIEQGVSVMTLSWGDAWAKLGETTTATDVPEQPAPQETPPVV